MHEEQPMRIFQELGEGKLDDEGVEALEAWLMAEGLETPPEHIVARARRISRQFRAPAPAAPSPIRRLLALLVYDTKAQPMPTGVRLVAQRTRRLLFQVDEVEVVLQVAADASPEQVKVMGQVLLEGLPLEGATVRLGGAVEMADEVTDVEGEFRLAGVPVGEYTLEIATSEQAIDMPAVKLEA